MSFQELKTLIPKDKANLHLRAQVRGEQVCMLWRKYAAKWFSGYVMKSHEPINFRDGQITIIVKNSFLPGQIKMQQRKIIQSINLALDKTVVKSIKYRF
ncbi:MAG: DciA family protein [Patescibacteria group bacterium]|nr:DciA family protein [Patescibacteria group bacterium]